MIASFFVNAMQVDFTSVLAMEHTGMLHMFNSLEETGLKGFLGVSNSVFEGNVTETSKVSGVTASEQQSTADSLQSLTKKPEKEAKANLETNPEVERQADDSSTSVDQKAHVECTDKTEIEAVTDEGATVVRMSDYDKWVHFRTTVRFNTVSTITSIESLAKIEDQFLFWAETEQVSELFERSMLVLYKLYEMEVQKRVDEHRSNFNPVEPSVNYDYIVSISKP
ncbi:hypothetical protein F511_42990 [Dorcoceras hygrometricum]|uniref:Uncharacterized protein n=1 Tax=Dorcoceras hygrometricum TaxID=472368 RepID=A0A2Z7CWQ7_9LAMI|nr:hypothetical protein F511_42990 [Dorcoceras hygrometricum]